MKVPMSIFLLSLLTTFVMAYNMKTTIDDIMRGRIILKDTEYICKGSK
jgi:hypothetical protein